MIDPNCPIMKNTVPIINWALGDEVPPIGADIAVAIGNFDGVHRGHQVLISAVAASPYQSAVMTFAPHPRRFFNPEAQGFALADEVNNAALLAAAGAELIIRLEFNEAMRQTSAEDFIKNILPMFGVKEIYAGEDFSFGKGRGGDMAMIKRCGLDIGIKAHGVPLMKMDDDVMSSSVIRSFIRDGNMPAAIKALGRPYIIGGEVIRGDARGRLIGFPTANMGFGDMTLPRFGVYAVLAGHGEKTYAGIANVGVRPTVNQRGPLLETHLFDYDGDLYGQRLDVFFLDFLRPEKKFKDIDELKAQIKRDAETARAYHLQLGTN